ncbi:translation initiation factor IF-3 [Paenibacillus sp. YN15]|uniref:translation initiation factor IF-3 n=1 Tax=Paenibacillus sp. YN15 TaxID=1742774 RepID=UPI000DCEB121|nr:translation initiation factor IF-3 [Paenibacillus sp. YN15]RAV04628.1 translation initiation factor IF-3 [Paenibacillus sp. YN15]
MIKNEKIKAAEVKLTGLQGEDLGIVPTTEALAMARKLKVDLVCLSLMESPPSCRLAGAGAVRQEKEQAKKQERPAKVKELRLTPHIEEHDLEVKRSQAERLLRGGDAVLLKVVLTGSKEAAQAKTLLEELTAALAPCGKRKTGIQLSGKQAAVQLDPL